MRHAGRQWWTWVLLVAFVYFQSYFVRELISALLFFTAFYLILAALVGLYILMDYGIGCAIAWALSFRHAFPSLARERELSLARTPRPAKHHAIHER